MKKIYLLTFSLLSFCGVYAQTTTLTIMENVIFYDGYAAAVSEPTPTDVIRFRNDLYTKKITASELSQIGSLLTVNITISALCDNYDRIGSVNLAMVPKGSATYNTDNVAKIELGRYITPFMNKNISPTSVPYTFNIDNVSRILKSPEFNDAFDFWLEFQVFGVPYAANTQVSGCSGRNDVFKGKIELVTNTPALDWAPATILEPLSFNFYINDYQAGASDAIGTTKKTVTFTVDEPVYDATFYLITSNHGANNGGEEYIRRWHYISVDGVEMLSYKPGGKSCEPYRMYNTQGNGIYGPSPRTEAEWLSFNNWCPGDVIPIRKIEMGTLTAGEHTFVINVPEATFNQDQGYFPFSLYLQGNKTSTLGIEAIKKESLKIFPNPVKNFVQIECDQPIQNIQVLNLSGQQILQTSQTNVDLSELASGSYFIKALLEDSSTVTRQFIKN